MSWLELYLIFAGATALAGIYELIMPVLWILKGTNPELNIVQYSWITYLVATIMIFVAAPIFFPLVLIPKLGSTFRFSLHKTLLNSQD